MADLNPATMSDEELDVVLAEAGAPTPADPTKPNEEQEPDNPTPPEEEEAPEPPEPEEEQEEAEEPEEAPEEPKPSRREQLRVAQLLARYGQPEAPQAKPVKAEGIDYEQELEAEPEVRQRLIADRQQAADLAYQRGLQQANNIQFHTRLEIDAPKVHNAHPILDKTNAKFDQELATAINTMYLDSVGYRAADTEKGIDEAVQRPNLRYGDWTEAIFELAHRIADAEVTETKKNITKQAAKTGLRPDGSRAKQLDLNKPPEAMTDEELDAIIAQAIPQK